MDLESSFLGGSKSIQLVAKTLISGLLILIDNVMLAEFFLVSFEFLLCGLLCDLLFGAESADLRHHVLRHGICISPSVTFGVRHNRGFCVVHEVGSGRVF